MYSEEGLRESRAQIEKNIEIYDNSEETITD